MHSELLAAPYLHNSPSNLNEAIFLCCVTCFFFLILVCNQVVVWSTLLVALLKYVVLIYCLYHSTNWQLSQHLPMTEFSQFFWLRISTDYHYVTLKPSLSWFLSKPSTLWAYDHRRLRPCNLKMMSCMYILQWGRVG